jgi:hypothetical protein
MTMQTRVSPTNRAYIRLFKWVRRPNERAFRTHWRTIMKTWIKTSLAAALAATIGIGATAAIADPRGDCDGPRHGMHGMKHRMDPAAMSERATERLASLQGALSLRPDQTDAWDQFKSVMQEKASKGAEHMQTMRAEDRPSTALERMDRMEAFGKARMESMLEVRKATEALYGKLDDAQKKTFDEQFRMGPDGMGRGGRGPGRMERGMRHGGTS